MKEYSKYEEEIIECCKKNNIFTIEMIFSFYSGISRSQFYELSLNKSDTIKNVLDDNKNRTKHSMLSKWYKSDAPALQIALMKIISTDEEAHRLNGSKQEVKNDIKGEIKQISQFTLEEAKEIQKKLDEQV